MVSLNFQKYEVYYSDDFATDLYFLQWIHAPENLTVSYFWENFLKIYPNKIHEIELARHKILKPYSLSNSFSKSEIESLWQQINVSISAI